MNYLKWLKTGIYLIFMIVKVIKKFIKGWYRLSVFLEIKFCVKVIGIKILKIKRRYNYLLLFSHSTNSRGR